MKLKNPFSALDRFNTAGDESRQSVDISHAINEATGYTATSSSAAPAASADAAQAEDSLSDQQIEDEKLRYKASREVIEAKKSTIPSPDEYDGTDCNRLTTNSSLPLLVLFP